MKFESRTLYVTGRALLGLYFILPGIMKITGFSGTADYMAAHGMVMVPFFLVLAIVIEIGGGVALAIGYRTQLIALVLAGLVVIINVMLHDFWSLEEGLQRRHELQNFIKNTAIMAGLLSIAGKADKI